MPIGRISNVNERGFAFLKSDQPPFDSTFVHFSELQKAGVNDPLVGMAFAYSIVRDNVTGKSKAVDCEWMQSAVG